MKNCFECNMKTSNYSFREKYCRKDGKMIPYKDVICDGCDRNNCLNCYHKEDMTMVNNEWIDTCKMCNRKQIQ